MKITIPDSSENDNGGSSDGGVGESDKYQK
jgi:hypothetical protein